jgi:L-2-hydroxyglutarate oxidase
VLRADVVVVGAGLVGLATARALAAAGGVSVAVVEKEAQAAAHQSGRNSGVLHAGLYYAPGSLKARFCRQGRLDLLELAREHELPHRICGKLVVAADERELPRFEALAGRGRANGLTIEELDPEQVREVEPNVRGVAAFRVEESGVIDFGAVAARLVADLVASGVRIELGRKVVRLARDEPGWRLDTDAGEVKARVVVCCGGLQADRLAALTGSLGADYRIVAFRGDYYTFVPRARHLVRGLVYPVPDPAFPFLGVHFTRTVHGELRAGPNAVPALAREGYGRLSIDLRDLWDTIRFPGFRRVARAYARTGVAEIYRDVVKAAYVRQMRRYVPAIESRDVWLGASGIRAQCVRRDGTLVDDFLIEEADGVVHVLNAPSPAATACLPIGRAVAERALQQLRV